LFRVAQSHAWTSTTNPFQILLVDGFAYVDDFDLSSLAIQVDCCNLLILALLWGLAIGQDISQRKRTFCRLLNRLAVLLLLITVLSQKAYRDFLLDNLLLVFFACLVLQAHFLLRLKGLGAFVGLPSLILFELFEL